MAEHDGRIPNGHRIDDEPGSVMQDVDIASSNAQNLGFRKLFCPRRGIDIAAHRYDGRDLAQPFEYLGLADISGMYDQVGPT
jgi:hypothetical protein